MTIAGLALLLAACGGGNMTKDGATQESYDKDMAECKYDAEKAVANVRGSIEAAMTRNDLIRSCLQARGYKAGA